MHLSRRDWIRTVPLASLALGIPTRSALADDDGMIVRMLEPRNLETPLAGLSSKVTATEKFFVRSHFAVPTIDPKAFKLTIEGHVENKLELTLEDLKKMEAVSREVTLECAGNGRVFLIPQARGLQWAHGGVGNAKWSGVPLGAILERARVKAGASDVVLVGADKGTIADPATPGAIHFDRGIPLAKAKKDESLVAWEMNGAPLTPAHGAPLRAMIGGWYGMASVKWLTRIVVTDRPHTGFWQTFDYSYWDRTGPTPQLIPLTAIQPKAIITSHGPNAPVPAGPVTLAGKAWAGEKTVSKVEYSVDSGKTWSPAKLESRSHAFTWTPWSASLTAGPSSIMVRCTDDSGRTQPATRDSDRRTYMINHLIPTDFTTKN